MSDQMIIGGAQTLGKRKAQQKKPNYTGTVIGPSGKMEYDQETLNELIKQELGYNFISLYMNDHDENELEEKPQFEREQILADRHRMCEEIKHKLNLKLELDQMNQKTQLQSQQQNQLRKTKQFRDDQSHDSAFSSEQESSYSNEENPEKRRNDKYDRKQVRKIRKAGHESSEEGYRESSEDDIVEYKTQRKQRDSAQKTKRGPARLSAVSSQKEVQTLEEMQKIILKRSKLEQWVDHIYFKDTVKGCFTRVSYKGHYRLAEIIDIREGDAQYDLDKKKTNIQLSLKYGQETQWFKLTLISNGEPTEDEFKRMIFGRQQAKDNPITVDHVQIKEQHIIAAKKFTYDSLQIEEMVAANFEKKYKSGKLQGYNLSFLKIEIKNDILLFQQKLAQATKPEIQRECKQIINDLEAKLVKVEQALKEKIDKDKSYFKTKEGGRERVLTIEELEKKQEADEWMRQQEFYMKNPNLKKNNYFMKHLTREDSGQYDLTEQEKQKKQIQRELELIRLRSQMSFEESKNETYFDKMERNKKEYLDFHKETKFSFENRFTQKNADGTEEQKIQFKPLTNQIKRPNLHPSWSEEFQRVKDQEKQEIKNANVKFISFDQYFNE